ncbi:MAG: DNA mismatch repair protein MutS [Acidobacteriota bacterium]
MDHLTPMMRQYQRIKAAHPDMLLFFRLGDFYEMFFEDAVIGSRELEITLTSRNTDRDGNPIPMCGIPHHAVGSYVTRLLKKGYRVAICDQVEDPATAKGVVRREVTRILTPGTALEEGLCDSKENNFLAAACVYDSRIGLSFSDVSTGELWVAEYAGEEYLARAADAFAQFTPRELLISEDLDEADRERLRAAVPGEVLLTPRPAWHFSFEYAHRRLLGQLGVATLEGYNLEGRRAAVGAAGTLLEYLQETQKREVGHLRRLQVLEDESFLRMDEATIRNLELVQGLDGNRRWTLLAVLDRTRTPMGARLLRRWILRPSRRLGEITTRHDAVAELLADTVRLGKLQQSLAKIQDLERLVGRITLETAVPRDLASLRASLAALPEVNRLLAGAASPLLAPAADELRDVRELLEQAVRDEPGPQPGDGRVIRPGYSAELDELLGIARSGKATLAAIEAREREATGIPSLKVRYNKVFGYFIEVTKAHLESVPEHYERKQTLAGAERYVTPELKEYEEKVLTAEERIQALERELFQDLLRRVAAEAVRILECARRVAQWDTLAALAEAAHRNRYVRPEMDESLRLEIVGGRHPVLEQNADEPFVPNDLVCDADGEQLIILTGPNMGGKSTYLRQNALIVIMAQMGGFVPAERARIGLVDRIFTRVGASDNLARGQSTFMVEMIETARILNTATRRSFILLDEVGRGTATFDGLSIAWAVAEYLLTEESRRARTLFATHYQELTRLEKLYPQARNYCVTVSESAGRIIFFHKVLPGTANRSYGIEVARLAGVPEEVVLRAREVLNRLEKKQLDLTGRKRASTVPKDSFDDLQPALFQ